MDAMLDRVGVDAGAAVERKLPALSVLTGLLMKQRLDCYLPGEQRKIETCSEFFERSLRM